jgi:hypothetical protein
MDRANPADYEYEIYVPRTDNAGSPYPEKVLQTFRDLLIEKFGGFTDTKHRNKGVWKIGTVEYHDELTVWRVLSLNEGPKDSFIRRFKRDMEKKLRQKEILIVRRQVTVIR